MGRGSGAPVSAEGACALGKRLGVAGTKARRTQFQGLVPQGKINMPWARSRGDGVGGGVCPGMGLSSGEGSVPSGSVLQDRAREMQAQNQGRGAEPGPAGLPLPAGGEAMAVPGGRVARRRCPQVVLLPLNSPTGKCLTWVGHWAASWKNLMSLHSTPSMDTEGDMDREGVTRTAKAIFPGSLGRYHPPGPQSLVSPVRDLLTSQHGLLLLGRANEAADAFDDLALRIHLFFSRFLAQEDGGNWKASRSPSAMAPGEAAKPLPAHPTASFPWEAEVVCRKPTLRPLLLDLGSL